MIGILIISHGTLGESLIQCACHVLNKRPHQIAQLGVSAQDDPLDILPEAQTLVDMVDSGTGVIVLTDIFGATPSNIAMPPLRPGNADAVSGATLPPLPPLAAAEQLAHRHVLEPLRDGTA